MAGFFKSLLNKFSSKPDIDWDELEAALIAGDLGPRLAIQIVDDLKAQGRKIAGAGQRRTARGLLHQGSVAAGCRLPEELAAAMAETVSRKDFEPDPAWLAEKISTRYSGDGWTSRR